MGSEAPDRQQQKVREFMSLLPLTIELAGLPPSEPGKNFNNDQLEARAMTIKAAYRVARQIIHDIVR
jgi:hypothetical protein